MKQYILVLPFLFLLSYSSPAQSIGIEMAVPDLSAALDITNASKGLLKSGMSTAAIVSRGNGRLVFDTQTNQLKANISSAADSNRIDLGFSKRDVQDNFRGLDGISSPGRFTLFNSNTNSSVLFVSFNVKCGDNAVTISWKITRKQDIRHFSVERSSDGIKWKVIGQLFARGHRTVETSYVFTDSNPIQNSLYRVVEYDLDGKVHYSGIIQSFCRTPDLFSVFPNPVQDKVFIYIFSGNDSKALIQLYDSKGVLVKLQNETLVKGSNLIGLDIKLLVRGIYLISAEWNHCIMQKRIKVIKHLYVYHQNKYAIAIKQ